MAARTLECAGAGEPSDWWNEITGWIARRQGTESLTPDAIDS